MLFMVGGIISSIVLGTMLDKYQCYKKIVQFICFLSILTNGVHFLSLPFKNPAIELMTMFFIGATVVPITPVAFAFTVELTFPVPEALTNGIMITCGLLWGTGEGLLQSDL
jgi:sugar phosphate permease